MFTFYLSSHQFDDFFLFFNFEIFFSKAFQTCWDIRHLSSRTYSILQKFQVTRSTAKLALGKTGVPAVKLVASVNPSEPEKLYVKLNVEAKTVLLWWAWDGVDQQEIVTEHTLIGEQKIKANCTVAINNNIVFSIKN